MPKTPLLLALVLVACRPPAANLDIGLVVEVRPARPGHGETRLALGDDHSCAIEGETLVCWGADNPIAGAGVRPTLGPTFAEGIEDIESGARGVCVLLGGGRVDCLGRPTPVGVENAVDLAVGDHHGCVVLAEGAVACWGSNDLAQLGVGDRVDHALVPGTVVQNSMRSAVMVAAGKDHTCAVDRSGGLWCWGGSPRSSGLEGVSPEHVHEIARVEAVNGNT